MMKKWFLPIVIFIAPYIVLLAACKHQVDIRPEAFFALEQMHKTSVQSIDADIAQIDQLLTDAEDKEAKLEQIVVQVQKWVEQKKAGDYTKLSCGWQSHLHIIATPEELAQIQQNNRYKVTLLELSVYHFDAGLQGLEFTLTFEVMDLTENQKYIADVAKIADVAQKDLRERKDILNSHKQEKVAMKNVLLSNLHAIREDMEYWQVKEFGKNAYYISGEGLGWSGEKLTSGTWDFRTDTDQMIPTDNEALALFNLMRCP